MNFRPLDRVDSEFNEGWRFGVACGSAAVLLLYVLSLLAILIGLMS
jgi:hypothetical protein